MAVVRHAEGVAGWAKALSSLPAFSADQPSDIVLSNPLALEDGVDILGARRLEDASSRADSGRTAAQVSPWAW